MPRKIAAIASGALLAALVGPALSVPAGAQETRAPSAGEPQTNVRVTIRLGRIEQGKRTVLKSYELLVAAGSPGTKLLSGARVPIPTEKSDAAEKGAGGEGATHFVYQNIGFSADAKVWLYGDNRVKLLAEIEDSRLKDRGTGLPPYVETRQLSLNAILTDGKAMDVTKVEGDTDPSGFVEVEAKILR